MMHYVESFDLFGVNTKQIPCIPGKGAPTTATEGAVGCLYMNTNNGAMYKCTAVSDGVYTWKPVETGSGGGGGGITEEDVENMLDAELGDKDNIFNYTEDYLVLDTEGSYADENGENIEQDGCSIYYLNFDGTEEFAGREIRVKTYMYGDMAINDMGFDIHVTNTKANITTNPESGIFDYAFSFEQGYGTELYISFCENDFLSEPIFYEKKGTVWEEIRKTNGRQSQFVNIPYLEDALSWYVMYEEIPYLVSEQIDINMEHITEQVIAALPVYGGELA